MCHNGTFVHRILTRSVHPRDCLLISLELLSDFTYEKIIFNINKIFKVKFVGEKKAEIFFPPMIDSGNFF